MIDTIARLMIRKDGSDWVPCRNARGHSLYESVGTARNAASQYRSMGHYYADAEFRVETLSGEWSVIA